MGDSPCQDFELVFQSPELYDFFWVVEHNDLRELVRKLRRRPYPDGVSKYKVPYDTSVPDLNLSDIWRAYYTEHENELGVVYTAEYFIDHSTCEIWITALDAFG